MQAPDDFDPPLGQAQLLQPGLRRIVAPNPSPMTYRGTNTYLVGDTDLAVIDPGPASETHLQAILAALTPSQRITHIIVTHSHLDHSPLAKPLSQATGAPVLAFGGSTAGRSRIMTQLVDAGLQGGGEGIDHEFTPDHCLRDGQVISAPGWALEVIHTPGHLGNHICLAWNDICFTADHVMGWASSLVSPPDGDLTDFMTSCETLQRRDWHRFYPGHGAAIERPNERLDWLIAHRRAREAAILSALEDGPTTAQALAHRIYAETPAALLPAATRNVFAHLIDLVGKTKVAARGELHQDATFGLC